MDIHLDIRLDIKKYPKTVKFGSKNVKCDKIEKKYVTKKSSKINGSGVCVTKFNF